MRKYRSTTGSTGRVEYGIELAEGLRAFPESTPLAAGFEALNEELNGAEEARRRLRTPMLKARSAMRVRSHQADRVLRQLSMAAKIADGGQVGPIHDEIYPQGLSPVVAPVGRRQLDPTKEVAGRLERSRNTKIEALRTEYLPKLRTAVEDLDVSIRAYDASLGAVMTAFKTEVMLRDEHALAVDKLMGEVRALFPGDRATQDAVFPTVTSRSSTASEPEEGDAETTTGDATDPTAPS